MFAFAVLKVGAHFIVYQLHILGWLDGNCVVQCTRYTIMGPLVRKYLETSKCSLSVRLQRRTFCSLQYGSDTNTWHCMPLLIEFTAHLSHGVLMLHELSA